MPYTDLTNTFNHNRLLVWQEFDQLAENDSFLRSNWSRYRRPSLLRSSSTYIEVETNGSDSTTTKILFTDGDLRSVSESRTLALGTQYIAGQLSETLSLVSPHNSGIAPGFDGSNAWATVYAVKTTDDTTKFVLAFTNISPIQANFVSLDNQFGSNGWVYLGTFRIGDIFNNSTLLLNFTQSGPYGRFSDRYDAVNVTNRTDGYVLVTQVAGTSVTFTPTLGMGSAQIPNHFTHLLLASLTDSAPGDVLVRDSSDDKAYQGGEDVANAWASLHLVPVSEGLKITTGNSVDQEIAIVGWIDGVLGVGVNPVI